MHPQLITGLPIQTFGLCVGLGVLLGWMLIDRLAKPRDLSGLVLLAVFAGIAGARLAHVAEYWHADGFDDISLLHCLRQGAMEIAEGKTENDPPYQWFGGVGKQHPFSLDEGKQYAQTDSVICYDPAAQ